MSADNSDEDHGRDPKSAPVPRYSSTDNATETEPPSMSSAFTMRPLPSLSRPRGIAWGEERQLVRVTPQSQRGRIELPSIGQLVPDIPSRNSQPEPLPYRSSTSFSPQTSPFDRTPPNYRHSLSQSKRMRLPPDDDSDSRDSSVPRFARSSSRTMLSQGGTRPSSRHRESDHSSRESWNGSSRQSPSLPSLGLPPIRLSSPTDLAPNTRPQLPSLQNLQNLPPLPSGINLAKYSLDPNRSIPSKQPSMMDPAPYQTPPFFYGYQKPHMRSYSGASGHHLPFSNHGGYASQSPHGMEMNEFGMGHDRRPRKRRGNLPRETTDILRAWFVRHLSHPYPSEDEKQQLMKQTNLQMNQISNWFINARRRQLPAMINNARAENNARIVRSREGNSSDYDDRRSREDSDGEESGYDDEYEERLRLKQKRGSI